MAELLLERHASGRPQWLHCGCDSSLQRLDGLRIGRQSRAELARCAGTYEIGLPDFAIRIIQRGATLRLEAPPPAHTSDLRHVGDGRFVAEDEPDAVELRFSGATGAPADRIQLMMAACIGYGRRVPPQK